MPSSLVQDEFLEALFPGEITDLPEFVKCSSRLRNAHHMSAVSCREASPSCWISRVIQKVQRAWFHELTDRTNAEHELHFIDASDVLCKRPTCGSKQESTCWRALDNRGRVCSHYCLFSASVRG